MSRNDARRSAGPPLARDEFDFEEGVLWVLHCAEGPVPLEAARAVHELLPRETRPWSLRWEEDFLAIPERARGECARLVGGVPEDVTLTATTSTGLVTVAQSYPWQAGDEVLVPLGEFPSNAWPWMALAARGVEFRETPLWDGQRSGRDAWASSPPDRGVEPEERLLEAAGPRTRVLSVSWVRFQDGLRLDLRRLAEGCADRGIHLVVDGIQGAGTLPLDPEGISAFASGGHKGLLCPQGMGFLWTDPSFRESLFPAGSWLSVEDATDFDRPSTDFRRDWATDGTRLEQGVPNLLGAAALTASLRLLNDAGIDAVARHVARLQGRMIEGLARIPVLEKEARRLGGLLEGGRLGSILALHHGGRGPAGLARMLEEARLRRIFASVREGYLRIALHGWHDELDVERILEWLARSA
jgi:selenocysteine lyase/cysteine desulfurase